MILDDKPFDEISADDIRSLVSGDVPEDRYLDYKQELPNENRVGEFLKDVCAFANAAGGYIVYGIEEELDAKKQPTGFPKCVCGVGKVANDEAIKFAWQQRALDAHLIEPRLIPPPEFRIIEIEDAKKVMVVHVPKSRYAPHWAKYRDFASDGGGTRRVFVKTFFVRHDNASIPMDINEVRVAFVDAQSTPQRMSDLRHERAALVLADEAPLSLLDGFTIVLHLIPFAALRPDAPSYDLTGVKQGLMPLTGSDVRYVRPDFEGLLYHSHESGGGEKGYCQVFQDGGTIEMVLSSPPSSDANQSHAISSPWFEQRVCNSVASALTFFSELGVQPPIYIGLSLLRAKSRAMMTYGMECGLTRSRIDPINRETLLIPPVTVESLADDAYQFMRPVFDRIWRASGFPKCPHYAEDGEWNPQQ